MHLGAVFFVLGNLMMILGLALWLPIVAALLIPTDTLFETSQFFGLGMTSAIGLALGQAIRLLTKDSAGKVGVREGFAIVSLAWVTMSLLGMLPYLLSGITFSVTDAFFETMSGFTTTGATTFTEIEIMPAGILVWRSMTQWLGGMGIVVLSIALLPILGVGGYRLMKAESPGGIAYERETPRITDAAKELWVLYVAFTAALMIILLFLGMSPLDAICHGFTILSTGGFSTHTQSIGYFENSAIQWVIIVFMLIGGLNFSLYSQALRRRFQAILANIEFRAFILLITGATIFGVYIVPTTGELGIDIRDAAFQVVTLATSTGFATVDYDTWPMAMQTILVMLMFIGGCMGSTAGGIKMMRVLVFAKTVSRELHRLLYPHGVRPVRIGRKVFKPGVVANIMAFGCVFSFAFIVGIFVMTACGYDLVTASSASVSMLSNMGPGLGAVGPAQNYAHLPDAAKWVMSFLMLLGRLELFSVVILFTPWVWRK